jgi:hypothetical protein
MRTHRSFMRSAFLLLLASMTLSCEENEAIFLSPRALSYPTTSAIYTMGLPIAENVPTVTGTVSNWSVTPTLPAGLKLDPVSGIISGTPTELQEAIQYKVVAANSAGSTNTSISITVTDGAPAALTYATTSAVYTVGAPIAPNVPSYTGTVETWSVTPVLPTGLSIDDTTGVISGTPTKLQAATEYVVTAANSAGSTTATISITVSDAAPTALTYATTSAVYTRNVPIVPNEPTVTGTVASWSVNPALPAGLTFNTTTGVISGTPTVLQSVTQYTITAANAYGSTTATISITVSDAAPTALTYATTSAVYTRNVPIVPNEPTVTGTVVSWSVNPALPTGLTLNTTTGVISGTPTVTQEVTEHTITATNSGGSTTAVISITVNEAAPTALSYSSPTAVYTIDVVITNNVPTVTGGVESWSITPALPTGLTLNTTTGVISGTPTVLQTAIEYTVTATNWVGSTTAVISITVNDAAPTALSYATTSAVYTKDVVIADNVPTVTGSVVSWSVEPALPTGLTLNTTTGVISGTPTVLQTATEYTVTATNSGGSTTAVISITVNDAAPTALSYSDTSPTYTIGEVIVDNVPTVTGSVVSWSVNPTLPTGLTLNTTTGVISGTPTEEHAATEHTITATNSGGSTTAVISIRVDFAPPSHLTYSKTAAVYTVGVVIADNVPTLTGTARTWSIMPPLPTGLSINTSTGVISGTPTTTGGPITYVVKAENPAGETTTAISITVDDNGPGALSYSTTAAVYTAGVVIANNVPTYTGSVESWSVSPDLPEGLTLNTSTGVISGTPTTEQASVDYTITAHNLYGETGTTISIAINDAPPMALSYATTTAVYTKDLPITDNVPTVTGSVVSWSVDPTLPAGLVLDTLTGVISGTPTDLQTATEYTVTATNAGGSTTAVISITVNDEAPSALSYDTMTAVYTVNTVIADNDPTVTGTIVSWSVTPALPPGLILNTTTGVISGTPVAVQTATEYTITATNTGGSTTATISIAIDDAAPSDLSYAVNPAVYTANVVITPNVPTYTGSAVYWAVVPSLPAGLTLNTTTGVITGTPTVLQESGADYTITAANLLGSTSATLSITINRAAPSGLSYSAPRAAYWRFVTIPHNVPTVTGSVDTYSVSPALPTGLTLDTTTAANPGGSTTATVRIRVSSGCHVTINEVQTTGGDGDVNKEFIELYNGCGITINLRQFLLRTATANNVYSFPNSNVYLAAGHFYVICGNGGVDMTNCDAHYDAADKLPAGGSGLQLNDGGSVDEFGYGVTGSSYVNDTPAPAPGNGQSVGRTPYDGYDWGSSDDEDFHICASPTPGASNN